MACTVEANATASKAGKAPNVKSVNPNASLLIVPVMGNVVMAFAFVTQDGPESIVKHVRLLLSTSAGRTVGPMEHKKTKNIGFFVC